MKPGARALGVAESFQSDRSVLCGAVVTGEGVVDGLGFAPCTVGGFDATEAIVDLWMDVGRPDVRVVLASGVALAWYNILDLDRLGATLPVPLLALTYEASDGLREAIEREFMGDDATRRIERFEALPPRRAVTVGSDTIYVRAINANSLDVTETVRTFTRSGGRPEPVRVARLAARAADRFARDASPTMGD